MSILLSLNPNIIMDIIVGCVIVVIIGIGIYINASRSKAEKEQKASRIDSLTGIPNRSHEEDIILLMERKVVGMFVIIDIDHFSSINETYGHEAGDKVLIALANCMVDVFRASDIILRIESDEFAVYCPRVRTREVGAAVLDRFLKAVEKIKLAEIEKKPLKISIGASFYAGQEEISYGDLFDAAFERCEISKESEESIYTLIDEDS